MPSTTSIEDFIVWHGLRVSRRTGKPPAPRTLDSKASCLRACLRAAQATDLSVLATIIADREQAECLFDTLASRMTSGSAANAFNALTAFGEYAKAMGWIQSVAFSAKDRPPDNPKKPIRVYSPDEMEALLGNARGRGLRWWAFLHTLADTGRRIGEVLALEWSWLNLSADVPHFNLPTTKNGKQQYVPLNAYLRESVFTAANIAELRAETRHGSNRQFGRSPQSFVFPWTHTTVAGMFNRYCEAVGVESRGFHCFRHTKATELLGKGVPLQAVSMLLGHSNVSTTYNRYHHATTLAYANYLD